MITQTKSKTQKMMGVRGVLLIVVLLTAAGFLAVQQPAVQAQIDAAGNSVQDRPITSLRDLSKAFVDISAQVKPSVVTVSTERIMTARYHDPSSGPFSGDIFDYFFNNPQRPQQQQPQEREYVQEGLGSGIIVSADGKILTNNHVVAEADSIFVRTFDGERYRAEVVGTDPETDIAVLQVDASGLTAIQVGSSEDLQVGEMVLAIGSPMSASLAYTVTQGIVSAKGRSNVGLANYEDFIQTDAAINPGNSGGPLVNLDGELIGVNTAIVSRSGGFQGIGFAVPSDMALGVMNALITDGRVVRGWLGVTIQDVNEAIADALHLEDAHGALIGDVLPDSPAEAGGVEAGDIIVAIDSREIENSTELRNRIAALEPGADVELTVLRDDDNLNLTVELGERPSDQAPVASQRENVEEKVGFTVATLTRELADRHRIDRTLTGVIVTSIRQTSEAYRAGLREGDVIRSVDRNRIVSEAEFNEALEDKESGDSVLLRVIRQGGGFYIAFNL